MKKKLFLIFILSLLNLLFADEMQLETYKINSPNENYCVTSEYMELIPLEFNTKDILFSIYKNGELYDNVNFQKVIKDSKKLIRTVSHNYWGRIKYVNNSGILLDTVEGKKIYDFETKKISSVKNIKNFYIVKDDLKILTNKKCDEYLSKLFDYIFTYDNKECASIIKKWEKYGVQISTEVRNNKEVIFFDFFYGADKKRLSSNGGITVLDGGNNFWRIYYDLKDQKFIHLDINGYA